jgi:hypothetical protein
MSDDDVSGIAVHIGARVAASAGSGETLVSSTVKDLVVGADLAFADRGASTLKGVHEWRLYAATRRATSTGSRPLDHCADPRARPPLARTGVSSNKRNSRLPNRGRPMGAVPYLPP